MDGTSGALYSIWMNALAGGFHGVETVDAETWATALTHALTSLCAYTNARPPSRTLMDPLFAFTDSYQKDQQLSKAVQAAQEATENTRNIRAKAGRAAYVEQNQLKDANVPDPGAYGVVEILRGIQGSLKL
jgi:dihydroxyacetone kinase